MFLKKFDLRLLLLSLWRFAGQPNIETHTFAKALDTVEASWLLMGIASYHFVNRSPIKRMYLFPLDSEKGPIMSKATCQNGYLVSTLSGCVCVSGLETSFDSILRKNLPTREHFFPSRACRIVLEPNQMSLPYQNVPNVHDGKVEFHFKVISE